MALLFKKSITAHMVNSHEQFHYCMNHMAPTAKTSARGIIRTRNMTPCTPAWGPASFLVVVAAVVVVAVVVAAVVVAAVVVAVVVAAVVVATVVVAVPCALLQRVPEQHVVTTPPALEGTQPPVSGSLPVESAFNQATQVFAVTIEEVVTVLQAAQIAVVAVPSPPPLVAQSF